MSSRSQTDQQFEENYLICFIMVVVYRVSFLRMQKVLTQKDNFASNYQSFIKEQICCSTVIEMFQV